MLAIFAMPDHVHILVGMKPSLCISDLVRDIKAGSSKYINDNKYESELFSDWAVRENKTLKEIFDECIEEVRFGKFKADLVNAKDTLNRVICRDCGLGVFRELAYQYRLNIFHFYLLITSSFSSLNLF